MSSVPARRPPEVSRVRSPAPHEDVVSTRRAVRSGGSVYTAFSRRGFLTASAAVLAAGLAACGRSSPVSSEGSSRSSGSGGSLSIGAIPDQDPEVLQRLYGTVADSMSAALDLDVT
ncbi:MAG: phosphonate transporter, periplasmic phosphonate-binding protein, partial [Modestobacter sp.]|nr:phosphonate transporter, periplasmic phosphonate-binding protein [Modestobacter sp.]